MSELLSFVIEHFFTSGIPPASEFVSRQLSAAGFLEDEINQFVEWLAALQNPSATAVIDATDSLRQYSAEEELLLDVEVRNYLLFLERYGVLTPALREQVIERSLALNEPHLNLQDVKSVVLLTLWNQRHALDFLILGELLNTEGATAFH